MSFLIVTKCKDCPGLTSVRHFRVSYFCKFLTPDHVEEYKKAGYTVEMNNPSIGDFDRRSDDYILTKRTQKQEDCTTCSYMIVDTCTYEGTCSKSVHTVKVHIDTDHNRTWLDNDLLDEIQEWCPLEKYNGSGIRFKEKDARMVEL